MGVFISQIFIGQCKLWAVLQSALHSSDATASPSQASFNREYRSQDDLSHDHFMLYVCSPVGDIPRKPRK